MSEEALTIWTVGHSTRTLGEFIELLTVNEIEALADVRRFPPSRNPTHRCHRIRTASRGTEAPGWCGITRAVKSMAGRLAGTLDL